MKLLNWLAIMAVAIVALIIGLLAGVVVTEIFDNDTPAPTEQVNCSSYPKSVFKPEFIPKECK